MELTPDVRLHVPVDLTFSDFILQRALQFGDRLAIIDDAGGRSCSYSQLYRDVIRCAAALYDLGLRISDRACIFMPNCLEYPIAFLAILQLKAICVPVNPLLTKYELRTIAEETEPKCYITTVDRLDVVEFAAAAAGQSNKLVHIITVGGDIVRLHSSIMSFHALLQTVPEDHTLNSATELSKILSENQQQIQAFDNRKLIATINYSSGTTGKPKGCMQSHHAYIANSGANNVAYCPSSHFPHLSTGDVSISSPSNDVTIAVAPMCHMYGILMHFAHGLTVGSQLVVMSRFNVDDFLNLAEKYKVTALYVLPLVLDRLLQTADTDTLRRSLATLRHAVTSAVPLSSNTVKHMGEKLPHVIVSQMYGMTEVMVATNIVPEKWKDGSSGRPAANTVVKIVDWKTRKTLGPNQSGELLFKSPSVMLGYWQNAVATRESFDDDQFFRTGDVGYFDGEGNVFIEDRMKDVMKYKGYQVSPVELESVIVRHPDVIDAAVVPIKDAVDGDLPRAFIVVKQPNVDLQKIVDFVHERVAPYKKLRGGVAIVDSIPRSNSGKILRLLLIKRYCSPDAASKL